MPGQSEQSAAKPAATPGSTAAGAPSQRELTIAKLRQSAAQIIATQGLSALTHRQVAAAAEVSLGTLTKYFPAAATLRAAGMEVLAQDWEGEIAEITTALAQAEPAERPRVLAEIIWAHLQDPAEVKSDCALAMQGIFHQDLRQLSLSWYRRLEAAFSPYVPPDSARALVEYVNGTSMMTAITGRLPAREHLMRTVSALWHIEKQ